MLIDELKKANMLALKNKDTEARAILSVVINKFNNALIEAKAQGKDLVDADLVAVIAKTLKELSDEKEGFVKVNNQVRVQAIMNQENTIKAYLPKMLSKEEIKAEIAALADQSMPAVMKHFKTNFAGKVDMALVNLVMRER